MRGQSCLSSVIGVCIVALGAMQPTDASAGYLSGEVDVFKASYLVAGTFAYAAYYDDWGNIDFDVDLSGTHRLFKLPSTLYPVGVEQPSGPGAVVSSMAYGADIDDCYRATHRYRIAPCCHSREMDVAGRVAGRSRQV